MTKEVEIPEKFICPLTLQILRFPYQDSESGHTYERAAILEWLWFGNPTCPLTRKPLHPSNFSLNEALILEIQAWRQKNAIVDDDNKERRSKKHSKPSPSRESCCCTLLPDEIISLREQIFATQRGRFQAKSMEAASQNIRATTA